MKMLDTICVNGKLYAKSFPDTITLHELYLSRWPQRDDKVYFEYENGTATYLLGERHTIDQTREVHRLYGVVDFPTPTTRTLFQEEPDGHN